MREHHRVLVVGWSSFVHGESTAGDVLAAQAVSNHLCDKHIEHDVAWSPIMFAVYPSQERRQGDGRNVCYEDVDPRRYTHVLFVCGPIHGAPIAQMHRRFDRCRRIAIGVTVIDESAPEVVDFHAVIARDSPSGRTATDLSASVAVPRVPVIGVILASGQNEYGAARQHDTVLETLDGWLTGRSDCVFVEIDTRLDPRHWRSASVPAQTESLIARCDAVVTMRMHGLVLALKNAVPAVAVDPVAGGGKVSRQASAWSWPSLIPSESTTPDALDRNLRWALSDRGKWYAREASLLAEHIPKQLVRLDELLDPTL
ncbi:polysaccharide pyruvyl transferase family protein [Rhodococcus fascians]|nr:polysaccharide pyruvyl transferase family protein [Rhodococcus fascians]MBY4417641.1 polysaccharide pyruvyl transferase family protein [Rhodococcus fascians]